MNDTYTLNGQPVENPMAGLTRDQRLKLYASEDKARERIKTEIASRTERPETDDQRLLRSNAEYAAELKAELPYALPARREQIKRRLAGLTAKNAELEQRAEAESRVEKLGNDPAVKNAREHAEAFGRTPPLGSNPDEVALAVALANSSEWDDPSELSRAYFAEVSRIESEALNLAQSTALEASATAAKAEAEAARAQASAVETAQRLERAKGMVDGN